MKFESAISDSAYPAKIGILLMCRTVLEKYLNPVSGIDALLDNGMLRKEGERGNTTYYIGDNYIKQANILDEALKIGLSQMQKTKNI